MVMDNVHGDRLCDVDLDEAEVRRVMGVARSSARRTRR
jgi:hypothetical protein